MTKDYRISPQGDCALVVRFGHTIDPQIHDRVMALMNYLQGNPPPAVIECVPAYTTLTIFYDPCRVVPSRSPVNFGFPATKTISPPNPYETLRALLENIIAGGGLESVTAPETENRVVEIPVHYGGDNGPDLNFVAEHCRLVPEEVIELHSAVEYLVYLIGFAPGFPYLGGMSERLATPRRATPRAQIPPGSIGIGGAQTGVYPMETPGGWHLIGRTFMRLFDPQLDPPSLLRAGDRVRFRPLSPGAGGARKELDK